MATPNVVPRADQEGGLGTSAKSWGKLFIENPADGGTAAATISNLDVDKIALDINANNTTANIIDITSTTLAGGKVMHVDIDDAGTTTHNNVGLNLDMDKSGVIASGQTVTTSGLILDLNDAATNDSSSVGVLYGIKSTLTNANATGAISQYGIQNTLSGGDTQWGIRNVCLGGTAATTTGLYQTVEDGGVDIKLNSSADTGDYFSIATTTHGATTITTVDDDADAAHLTLDIDGNIILDSHEADSASSGIMIKNQGTDFARFNTHHSASFMYLYENGGASTDDYFSIQVNEHGETILTTRDDAAAAAHFKVVADGAITLDASAAITFEQGANSASMPASDGKVVVQQNFLKVMPDKFLPNGDSGRASFVADQQTNKLGIHQFDTSDELYAHIEIPFGHTVTEVHVYTSATVSSGVTVGAYNYNTGADNAVTLTTGDTNAVISLGGNSIAGGASQDLWIKVALGSAAVYLWGAKVTLTA